MVFCDFLTRWPSLEKARRARCATIEKFFKAANCRYQSVIDDRIETIQNGVPLTNDPAVINPAMMMVAGLVRQLKQLLVQIDTFDNAIKKLYVSHADVEIYRSLPGCGSVYGPRLLVAMGSDRERYDDASGVAKYAGIAPVVERSGNKEWIHWRWSCPKFLRQSFVEWSGETIRRSFWAKAYYDQQKKKGKSHQAAIRSLAFKWIRIIFRLWKDRTLYDESKYLMALQKRGSSLLENIAL